MTLAEVLKQAWVDHEKRTAEVARRLEESVHLVEDDGGAAQLMNLAIHAVGDHLGDRARARRLCEAAFSRLGQGPGDAPLLYLAVARRLDGDEAAAQDAQSQIGSDPSVPIRIDMLVAQGLAHEGAWAKVGDLYGRALAQAEALPAGHAGERATAIVSNNLASALLERSDRSATEDALMMRAAQAAKTFWVRVGTWENDERGDYLLALVHHALGQHAEARACAERGLATIARQGQEPVDEAFLHLARARACRDGGDVAEHAASLAKADALAADFDDEGERTWFATERDKSG